MSEYQDSSHLYGVERASEDLIERIRSKGREVIIAKPGTEDFKYLELMGAEGNVGNHDLKHILLRENPSKAAVLEEFIHGVQHDVGAPSGLEHRFLDAPRCLGIALRI